MRHLLAWTMVVIGGLIATGCKDKTEQAPADATAKVDSTATAEPAQAPQDAPANPPATFHLNKGVKATSHAEKVSGGKGYTLQISVFKIKRQAESFAKKLSASGLPAYVAEVVNPTEDLSGDYYRVRVGTFGSRSEAEVFAQQNLKPKGFDFWIDSKSMDHVGNASASSTPAQRPYMHPAPAPVTTPASKAYTPPPVVAQPQVAPRPVTKQPSTPVKHVGLDVPASEVPSTEKAAPKEKPEPAPAGAIENPTYNSQPNPGYSPNDSMRSPFAQDEPAPAETGTETPPSAVDTPTTHRVLPTW